VTEVDIGMNWKNLLESVSESVNDELRLRNTYLVAENRILRNQIDGWVQLTDSERKELAEIGVKLGKKALAEIATIAQPETILGWNHKLAMPKRNISEPPKSVGRPRVNKEIEDWVLRMVQENRSWGYDRIQGALKHLGFTVSDQTVGNILKRNGISPAPERKKTVTWREFIRFHLDVLLATDFFSSDTPRPLGGASSGQVGPADYRLLRGHLPFIGRRCFYWGSYPPIPLRMKIYLGGICPPNPLTRMPFLPAQRAGLPGIVSDNFPRDRRRGFGTGDTGADALSTVTYGYRRSRCGHRRVGADARELPWLRISSDHEFCLKPDRRFSAHH
jgi:hypothetical protein